MKITFKKDQAFIDAGCQKAAKAGECFEVGDVAANALISKGVASAFSEPAPIVEEWLDEEPVKPAPQKQKQKWNNKAHVSAPENK